MATASLLASFAGGSPLGSTGVISVSEGDYIIAFVATNGTPSISADSSGPPDLALLASVVNNPTIDLIVFGARMTSSKASFQYNVVTSNSFGAIFYKVVPSPGEYLNVVNTINTQKATYPTSISIQTSQDPQNSDVIFGFSASESAISVTDTDTTRGSWSSRSSRLLSYGGNNWYVWGQYKEITGEGQQTYDGSYSSGSVSSMIVTVSASNSYWGIKA